LTVGCGDSICGPKHFNNSEKFYKDGNRFKRMTTYRNLGTCDKINPGYFDTVVSSMTVHDWVVYKVSAVGHRVRIHKTR